MWNMVCSPPSLLNIRWHGARRNYVLQTFGRHAITQARETISYNHGMARLSFAILHSTIMCIRGSFGFAVNERSPTLASVEGQVQLEFH